MRELDDIFYKLARAGYDVSSAQRDYRMLQQFIDQFAVSPDRQAHHRTAAFPTSSGPPQSAPRPIQPRHRSDSVVIPSPYSHPHTLSSSSPSHYSPPSPSHFSPPSPSQFYAPRPSPTHSSHISPPSSSPSSSGSSGSSSRRSSTTSTTATHHVDIASPAPNRLVKPRRMSAPAMQPMKKVHFASHATVYTFSTSAPAGMPMLPPRPSCQPRGHAEDHR